MTYLHADSQATRNWTTRPLNRAWTGEPPTRPPLKPAFCSWRHPSHSWRLITSWVTKMTSLILLRSLESETSVWWCRIVCGRSVQSACATCTPVSTYKLDRFRTASRVWLIAVSHIGHKGESTLGWFQWRLTYFLGSLKPSVVINILSAESFYSQNCRFNLFFFLKNYLLKRHWYNFMLLFLRRIVCSKDIDTILWIT